VRPLVRGLPHTLLLETRVRGLTWVAAAKYVGGCRANMANVGQSRPYAGLGVQVKVLAKIEVCARGSEAADTGTQEGTARVDLSRNPP